MTAPWRVAVRILVIAAGASVLTAGVLAFEPAKWPIYLTYLGIALLLYPPVVQVLPGLYIGIPSVAAGIGFLYVAGPPIIVLNLVMMLCIRAGRKALPASWLTRLPWLAAVASRRDLAGGGAQLLAQFVPESATYALGLGARWAVASSLAAPGVPSASPWAMAAGEAAGYAVWGVLSILPIYSDRSLLPLADREGLLGALADMRLIFPLALTPFVYLIAYGYQTDGLSGAVGWTLATIGLHFMLRRMNDRRRMLEEQNRQLVSLNRELEHRERLSAIGKMSSVVSHQILHQLGVIGIYADLVRNSEADGDTRANLEQVRSYGLAIEEALRDVNRVLTDLLVFSRDMRLNLYSHPLARVIEECVESTRAEAGEGGVTVRIGSVPPLDVIVDKLKIKQAIANVLRNAIEVSPSGSEIVVQAIQSDGHVEIRVSDRGPGVPEKDREAVFTPFFTTKEHGTGLGLAIAREFTDAHGGRLWIEPRDGTGTTFVLRLPLTPGDRAGPAPPSA